ncbi:MAG: fumarate hydratase [Desulfatiglandales bacterium]
MNYPEVIMETVAETLVEASTTFREDQVIAYKKAIEREDNPNARWVLEKIIENAEVAEEIRAPLCDDTGIPHVYLEIGKGVSVDGKFFRLIDEGVKRGLQRLPGRPMAVKGNELERLGQNKGLYQDSGMLVPAPLQIRTIDEKKIVVTVMMLGGGPEMRAKTYHVFHRHQGMNVIDEATRWATDEVRRLGCTPAIPAIGIGRTHYEATCLMLEAIKEGSLIQQSDLEKRVTDKINSTNAGPLGLGGKTTALGTFVKIGSFRAGGSRIVSMRLGCCFDPRRATREIPHKI